jgi:hypothetical protein
MIEAGLWLDRKQRRRRVHQPAPGANALASWCRSTAASTGGSRIVARNAPLLVFIDDASGRLMHLQFVESES